MYGAATREELLAHLAARDRQIAELLTRLSQAESRIKDLEAKLGQSSRNSSMPPSSDSPSVARAVKTPTGRKRGGQPGHAAHLRELLPASRVTDRTIVKPETCERCGERLRGTDAEPHLHQVIDLPEPKPRVHEWELHALPCDSCHTVTRAKLPAGVPAGNFGPGIAALIATLTGRVGASKRIAREFLESVLGIELSLGTVSNLEQLVARALEPAYEEVRETVLASPVLHADETGWREDKRKAWLWTIACRVACFFQIARSRGSAVAKKLLDGYDGVVCSDRWSGYTWLNLESRQICWAHLKRDFQGWVERGGEAARLGTEAHEILRKLLRWRERARADDSVRASFDDRVQKKLRPAFQRLLGDAAVCADAKVRGMATELLKVEPALWTCALDLEVEPTNNRAERSLRPAVILRKRSFGTDSPRGSRYVERVLTVDGTCRVQGTSTFRAIHAAVVAYFDDAPAPRLLSEEVMRFAA